MKVKEFAEKQGVTIQAVYQRLKGLKSKTGQPMSVYIEPDTKELTGEGLNILTKLYEENKQIKEIPSTRTDVKLNALKTTIEKLETELNSLKSEVEYKNKEIEQLHKLVDTLKDQVDGLKHDKTRLEKETETREELLNSLTKALSQPPRLGFFKRLFSGKKEQ